VLTSACPVLPPHTRSPQVEYFYDQFEMSHTVAGALGGTFGLMNLFTRASGVCTACRTALLQWWLSSTASPRLTWLSPTAVLVLACAGGQLLATHCRAVCGMGAVQLSAVSCLLMRVYLSGVVSPDTVTPARLI
jgi:hypothetical protein